MNYNDIILTNVSYSYDILMKNINSLSSTFPFLEIGNIGKSVLGKNIPYIRIGKGAKEVFYNASFHANEWITSSLVMKFIEDFCKAYVNGNYIFGYDSNYIFNNISIYIIPMVNPDGVDLVTGVIKSGDLVYDNAKKIAENYPDIPFPNGWKANIQGIDLNLQFPAKWKEAKKIKFEKGFMGPAPRDFVGDGPLTAIEALNVYNFTLSHNFRLINAFHSQGEVIYWKFLNYLPPASYYIGEQYNKVSGYILEDTPYASSFAGYKDWFIQEYNLPGYTIEVGLGENPLPISQFDKIYNDIFGIFVLGAVLAK